MNDLPTTLTVEEAGRLLGLSRSAAYEAVARGEMPMLRFGRRVVVPTAKILGMLEPAPAPMPIPDPPPPPLPPAPPPPPAPQAPAKLDMDPLLVALFEIRDELQGLSRRMERVETILEVRKRVSIRGVLSDRTREQVQERDRGLCRYCGWATNELTREFDHYVPVTLGGTTTFGNMVTACRKCNSRKGSTHPDLLDSIGMRLLPVPGEPETYPSLKEVARQRLATGK